MPINLVDHRQEPVGPLALAPVDLVNPDRMHSRQLSMGQAPFHKPLHRMPDRFPTGLESSGRVPPRQPPRPAGQKPHHRRGHRPLALTPGYVLDAQPVLRTFHAPGRVEEVDDNAPQRHEQPASLGQLVIARTRLQAPGALAPDPRVRRKLHRDPQRTARAQQPDALVNESHKMLNSIQDRLNLQLSGWPFVLYHTRFKPESVKNGQPLLSFSQ
jgi:hypothetical protein